MKMPAVFCLAAVLAAPAALAGGGGCGDECDQVAVKITCTADTLDYTDAARLSDKWDKLGVQALKRTFTVAADQGFSFVTTTWSVQPFDPEVIVEAWLPGTEAFSNKSRTTSPYRLPGDDGAFVFAGTGSTGWAQAVFSFKGSMVSPTTLTVKSQATGATLVRGTLDCHLGDD